MPIELDNINKQQIYLISLLDTATHIKQTLSHMLNISLQYKSDVRIIASTYICLISALQVLSHYQPTRFIENYNIYISATTILFLLRSLSK